MGARHGDEEKTGKRVPGDQRRKDPIFLPMPLKIEIKPQAKGCRKPFPHNSGKFSSAAAGLYRWKRKSWEKQEQMHVLSRNKSTRGRGCTGSSTFHLYLSINQCNGYSCPYACSQLLRFWVRTPGAGLGFTGGSSPHIQHVNTGLWKAEYTTKKKKEIKNKAKPSMPPPCKLYRQKEELEANQFVLDSGV